MASKSAIVVQVLVGLVIVYLVYFTSLFVLRKDKLVVDRHNDLDPKTSTIIIDGFVNTSTVTDRRFDTMNPSSRSFRSMPRSFNRMGGAQYTYSMWMQLRDISDDNVAGKVILLRGDKQLYSYTRKKNTVDSALRVSSQEIETFTNQVLVKGPLIRFGENYKTLVVEFNTMDNPNEKIEIRSFDSVNEDTSLRRNILKLIPNAWVLFTFTFYDNSAINEFEDGIAFRFYINDFLYHSASVKSTLYQNNAPLHLLPVWSETGKKETIRDAMIGNLKYHNYAVGPSEVAEEFARGPPSVPSKSLSINELGDPLYLSIYNKMDVFNT